MNATRPRHSVLSLFDPLVDEQRDASSPDSDKENSASFFGRSFKPASPVVLKRRLVDVGDVTLDDASMLMMLTDEEELDDIEDDENDTLIFRVPTATPARSAPSPRTPLGEITLEDDTPVARSKVYKRPPPSSSLSSTNDSSISSVINAVNASGISFASPGPKSLPLTSYDLTYDREYLNATDTASQNPIITISSSDTLSNSLSTLNLNTPIGSLLTDMSRPFETTPPSVPSEGSSSHLLTRLRPNPPSTSSRDHNRHSIDLHSSFQLQLQSEESSFDLLNDKFSFFASTNGADSFLNAMEGDDSFDMAIEEANLENALEKLKLEDKAKESTKEVVALATPETQRKITPTSKTTPGSSRPSLLKKRSSFGSGPNSPVSSLFTFGQLKSAAKPSPPSKVPTVSVATSSPTAPVFTARAPKPTSDICTPAPPPRSITAQAAVPALRIVKRAKHFGHDKSGSSGSASSSEASIVPDPAPVSAPPRPITVSNAGLRRVVGSARVVAPQPTSTAPPVMSGGPRRVLIADNQPPTAAPNVLNPRTAGLTGARRVLVAGTTAVPAPPAPMVPAVQSKAPVASGLKAPVKYGGGSVSALPRPVSRLPAPSASVAGGVRSLGAAAGSRLVSGNQGAAGRTIPARRMAYGGQ